MVFKAVFSSLMSPLNHTRSKSNPVRRSFSSPNVVIMPRNFKAPITLHCNTSSLNRYVKSHHTYVDNGRVGLSVLIQFCPSLPDVLRVTVKPSVFHALYFAIFHKYHHYSLLRNNFW